MEKKKEKRTHRSIPRLHGASVVSTIASQQEGSWFKYRLGPFCTEFACSPRANVGSLQELWRLPTI